VSLNQIRDLNFADLGNAPLGGRLFILCLIVLVILVLGYMLQIKDQRGALSVAEQTELRLRGEFEGKQQKAANLNDYKIQLAEMQDLLETMLRQLPGKTEMPELLIDISQTALATGIENQLFEPRSEILKGFYAERPISIRMLGNYHQFGQFISGVASLPRVVILTMNDIELEPVEGGVAGKDLRLEGTIKTYRYLDEDELLDQQASEVAQ